MRCLAAWQIKSEVSRETARLRQQLAQAEQQLSRSEVVLKAVAAESKNNRSSKSPSSSPAKSPSAAAIAAAAAAPLNAERAKAAELERRLGEATVQLAAARKALADEKKRAEELQVIAFCRISVLLRFWLILLSMFSTAKRSSVMICVFAVPCSVSSVQLTLWS